MVHVQLDTEISKKVTEDPTYAIPEIQKMRVQNAIDKTNELITQSEKLLEEV